MGMAKTSTIDGIASQTFSTPLGEMVAEASADGLGRLEYIRDGETIEPTNGSNAHIDRTIEQLSEYFAGERTEFGLALDPIGTPFQRSVWDELVRIPFGETCSYAQLANRIGNPKAVRAVGLANGRNPIAIVVPCHRVIGADGALRGYAGQVWRKEELLRLEGAGLFSSILLTE